MCLLSPGPSVPRSPSRPPPCDHDNGGLLLPPGFCALVVADRVGPARHLVVTPDGAIYVALGNGPGILALRDTTGDGKPDVRKTFGPGGGSGIALGRGALYFSTSTTVYRYTITPSRLAPVGNPVTIVRDLPPGGHDSRSLALSLDGRELFVDVGSKTNSCQMDDRGTESPGFDPCAELDRRAGIWRFDAGRTGQRQADGVRYATGIRNAVALALDSASGRLYAVQHGRDQLGQSWPRLFTLAQSAELPSEELVEIEPNDDFGWPYCYHDPVQRRLELAPEYGGDGRQAGRCGSKKEPLLVFPAHWAPDGLVFYTGTEFPPRYRGGAFIAFHGSWNRAPYPQAGYRVVFVPFENGAPTGRYETFADGFRSSGAEHRPVGVAQGPDGSLYITDDARGRIWRVFYEGGKGR